MAEETKTKGDENLKGALAYLLGFITGIIFLVIEKDNKYIRFHAMQSTILSIGLFVVQIGLGLIPVLGWIVGFLLSIAGFILWILMMWKAYNGEMYKLPYVGEMAEKQLAKMGK